ncbi:MAG: hypothetical protein LBS55_12840 [Prevotellaceae bacterium]|jgi:hypothetical protein|nr:hypothetical protein [Prevotellaceae bacterium]
MKNREQRRVHTLAFNAAEILFAGESETETQSVLQAGHEKSPTKSGFH